MVVNLASREYSETVEAHLKDGQKLIHIVFLHKANGSLVTKGTLAKMARGSMVRWLAENQITDAEEIRAYCDGYTFSQAHSDASHYVFLQTENSSR